MSIESVMPSNHLLLCHPLFLLASIFPRIRIFSKESVLCIRCPKYWSFSISPSNEYSGSISLGLTGLSPDELTSKGLRSSSVAQWVEPGFGTRQLWGHDLATTKLSESQLPHEQKVSKIIFFTEFLWGFEVKIHERRRKRGFLLFFWLYDMQDPISLARAGTWSPCNGSCCCCC